VGSLQKKDDVLAGVLAASGLGDIIRFDHLRQQWLIWNGVRWRPDKTTEINDLITRKVIELLTHAGYDPEDQKVVSSLYNESQKEAVKRSLAHRRDIAMDGTEWDINGHLVGFDNGIIDLETAKFFEDPDPTTLVSKSVRGKWDPKSQCPTFEWFIKDITADGDGNPQPDLEAYLWRLMGYFLLGTQVEQKFWMWVGRGSNGKGVLARTLAHVFGDYADTPSDTLYMQTKMGRANSSAATPELVRLQGVRFTYMSEPPGGKFDDEKVKAHTGEDEILARDLYGRAAQMARFTPTHKLVFLTNDPPRTDDTGVSMRRRARVIMFQRDYEKKPDKRLEEKLRKEKDGILRRITLEAAAYLQDSIAGDGLTQPDLVTAWSEAYIAENDPLTDFLDERCVVGPREKGSLTSLFNSYEDWAIKHSAEMLPRRSFSAALDRKGFRSGRTNVGQTFRGLRSKNAMELAEAGASE